MLYVSANEKAVSLNLHRYTEVKKWVEKEIVGDEPLTRWGCTSSRIQLTHSSKAPGFQPLGL